MLHMGHVIICGACGFEIAKSRVLGPYMARIDSFHYVDQYKKPRPKIVICPGCGAHLQTDNFKLEITKEPNKKKDEP